MTDRRACLIAILMASFLSLTHVAVIDREIVGDCSAASAELRLEVQAIRGELALLRLGVDAAIGNKAATYAAPSK